MIVKADLTEILEELSHQCETAALKGQGASSFVNLVNKGSAVEISEDDGGFWLEFWEPSDDEDAGPVKESTVATSEDAIRAAIQWLK